MIVIYTDNDKDAHGYYPWDATMKADLVLVQESSGNLKLVKNRYTGDVGAIFGPNSLMMKELLSYELYKEAK